MLQLSAAFEGLDKAFDTDFDEEDDIVFSDTIPDDDNNIQLPANNKIQLPMEVTNDDKIIRNTDFVAHEIKSLIESSKLVLTRLDTEIKIGSAPRMYEVYSQLSNSITAQLKELRHLHESVAKIKIEQSKRKLNEIQSGDKIEMTSTQLLDMIEKAKDRSEIKSVEAKFEVIDEDFISNDDDE